MITAAARVRFRDSFPTLADYTGLTDETSLALSALTDGAETLRRAYRLAVEDLGQRADALATTIALGDGPGVDAKEAHLRQGLIGALANVNDVAARLDAVTDLLSSGLAGISEEHPLMARMNGVAAPTDVRDHFPYGGPLVDPTDRALAGLGPETPASRAWRDHLGDGR